MTYKFAPFLFALAISLSLVSCVRRQQARLPDELDYHLKEMSHFWLKLVESEGSNEQEKYILKFKNHQKALVEKEYFKHARYKFDWSCSDKEKEDFLAALSKAIGNVRNGYFEGPDPATGILTVWFSKGIASSITKIKQTYDLQKINEGNHKPTIGTGTRHVPKGDKR